MAHFSYANSNVRFIILANKQVGVKAASKVSSFYLYSIFLL